MIKDGRLSLETQMKIEFLPLNNGSKKCLVKICVEFCIFNNLLSTTSLNFFKSTGTVFDLPTSKSSTFVFTLFQAVGALTNLLMSSLSTLAFKTIERF